MSGYSEALQDATARLYAVFTSDNELTRDSLHPDFKHLAGQTLDSLSVSDLNPLIRQVNELDGAERVVRQFLPRILELCIEGYHKWSMPLEQVFGTLNIAGWESWSEIEKRTIEDFLRALWLHHLHEVSPSGTTSSADTILDAIGQVMDVQPFLEIWLDVPEKSATAHIASLTVYGEKKLDDVRHWLAHPHILQRIEEAFWDCTDVNHAAMFAKAAECLRLDDAPVYA